MTAPLLAVDAPSLYFRAYFGVPESSARTATGQPVNAIRGFLDMIATLVRTRRPDRIVCALDADWRPAWRVELLPSYKAHRVVAEPAPGVSVEEVPDTLAPQVPMLLEVLDAFGIAAFGVPGYEADDVLGTVAARATREQPVEVVSGDRDLFQLVDDERGVRLLYVGRGVAKLEDCDAAAVRAKYGVPPEAYVDFAILRGDPSDGLPGVAGIGEKTACALVNRFGNLAGIRAAAAEPVAEMASGIRAKITAAAGYLDVAPKVVRVADDAPLPHTDFTLPKAPRDADRVLRLAEEWNLAGSCRRLVDALAGD
ncbi:MAG: 5'-3' exonuclease [Hamadaea sp.]|nr:5'-3' exonuclease [Hamadaea sp.]